jgi:hypothetical protein
MIALGELQKHAGPDQRVTARAEVLGTAPSETSFWSAVWDASSGSAATPVWLVSGENPNPGNTLNPEKTVELLPAIDVVSGSFPVSVEAVDIAGPSDQIAGRFAYWAQEENTKARLNRADKTENMAGYTSVAERQDVRESLQLFPTQNLVFETLVPATGPEGSPTPISLEKTADLGRAQTVPQMALAFPIGADAAATEALINERRHDFSVYAASISENMLQGGLKTNLTGITQTQVDALLELPENENDYYLHGDFLFYYNIDPTTGIPFPKSATPNDDSSRGNVASNGDLVRTPTADFFDFRDNKTNPADGEMQVVRNIMPVVTEASFRLGAFHNSQPSDFKHRIRFHADVEFWNPYPFPIRFPGEGQSRVFSVMLLPSKFGTGLGRGGETEKMILSVERFPGGSGSAPFGPERELHTNLFDFDEQLISRLGTDATNNTIDETVMNSWMIIDNTVLQPGEVYRASTGQTEGLARELGGFILSPGGDPENPADYVVDPNHYYNKWGYNVATSSYSIFQPDDRIEINLRMPPSGLTFRIIAFDIRSRSNTPVYEEAANSWAMPLFEFRHLYKIQNPPSINLQGSEYTRASSGSYTINNMNIGFHFRLDDERMLTNTADGSNLWPGFDFRQPVWDYENPAVKQAVMVGGVLPEEAATGVEPNPFNAPNQSELFFNGEDLFADSNADSHGGNFERAFLYHQPTGEPLSVGSFRQLPLSYETVDYDLDNDGQAELVQLKVGAPWGGFLNRAFDKYFFTGAPASGWAADQPFPFPLELRAGTNLDSLREDEAATELLVEGGFNINSLSPRAWAAMLSRTIHNWEYNGPGTASDLTNTFLNLGASTDAAIRAHGGVIPELSLSTAGPDLEASKNLGRLSMRYPLRQLTTEQIYKPEPASAAPVNDSLVEFLIEELENYHAANPPFASVSEFINSGVLHRAIRNSDINGDIPRFSPAYITQASVLEPIAPFLTARSDTFTIRSIGIQLNPVTGETGNRVIAEAVVQRIPDRIDGDSARRMEKADSNGNSFGRRFVIKQITWKQDDS